MELAQEKFNLVKELAVISTAISEARSTLDNLKKNEEQYLRNRETQVHDRITRVLSESQDALEKTSSNHSELVAYGNELKAFSTELKGFADIISTLTQDFGTRLAKADEDMNKHFTDVNEVLKQQKIESAKITQDREQLKRERQQTQEGMRLLKDKEEQFLRSVEHINKLAK